MISYVVRTLTKGNNVIDTHWGDSTKAKAYFDEMVKEARHLVVVLAMRIASDSGQIGPFEVSSVSEIVVERAKIHDTAKDQAN